MYSLRDGSPIFSMKISIATIIFGSPTITAGKLKRILATRPAFCLSVARHFQARKCAKTGDMSGGACRDLQSIEIRLRFERDWPIRKFSNRRDRACSFARIVSLVKRLKPLTALS